MYESNANVTRSPKLAAIGVATLSGSIPYFLQTTITATIIPPSEALANDAVISELAHSRKAWWILKSSLGIHRNITAAMDANVATINAWT